MFGLFKKKALEPVTARDVSRREWILWLTSLYAKGFNLAYRKDLLQLERIDFSEEPLVEKYHEPLISHLDGLDGESLTKAIGNRLSFALPDSWSKLLIHVYTRDREEIKEFKDHASLEAHEIGGIDYILLRRERFEKTNYNLYLIANYMWRVRIAVYAKLLSEADGWMLLELLADEAENAIAGTPDWEAYFQNLIDCINLEAQSISGWERANNDAKKHLLTRADSPLRPIALHAHISPDLPAAKIPYSNIPADIGEWSDVDPRYGQFSSLLKKPGDKQELWDLLDDLRANAPMMFENCLDLIKPDNIPKEAIIDLPEQYPDNGYAHLLRMEWYCDWGFNTRGSGTNDTVSKAQALLFREIMDVAIEDGRKARALMPDEPNVITRYLEASYHTHSEYLEERNELTEDLLSRFPHHLRSLSVIQNYNSRKWGGSHEQSYAFARKMIEINGEDSDVSILLFQAACEEWLWHYYFQDDIDARNAHIDNEELCAELDKHYPHLISIINAHWRYAPGWLFLWYNRRQDRQKLKDLMRSISPITVHTQLRYVYNPHYYQGYINWLRYL